MVDFRSAGETALYFFTVLCTQWTAYSCQNRMKRMVIVGLGMIFAYCIGVTMGEDLAATQMGL